MQKPTAEEIVALLQRHGVRVELGAMYSVRGQIAQVINVIRAIQGGLSEIHKPTETTCWDGGEHEWTEQHGDAWCRRCGCRGITGQYLGPDGDSILGQEGQACDVDPPTMFDEQGKDDLSDKQGR